MEFRIDNIKPLDIIYGLDLRLKFIKIPGSVMATLEILILSLEVRILPG